MTPRRRYHVVLNALSGTAAQLGVTPESLSAQFAAAGLTAHIDADPDSSLDDKIAAALASDSEVIVAAGGDGTVTAVATAVVGTDKTLAVLPLGTANLLARDLKIPLDLDETIRAMAAMEPRRIDVGEVNGIVFLHKVVIGFVPGVAAGRERLRGQKSLASTLKFLRFFLRRLSRSRRIAVEIDPSDGRPRIERARAVAVANNSYDEQFGHFFSRACLDGGSLGLYVLNRLELKDIFRLSIGMLVGRWRKDEALSVHAVRSVTIRSRRERIMAMLDGEVRSLEVPLEFRTRPGALSILAPAAAPVDAPA